MSRPRNLVALSPLLRKGGVHQRSQTGVRQQQKHSLEQAMLDWQIESLDDQVNEVTATNVEKKD